MCKKDVAPLSSLSESANAVDDNRRLVTLKELKEHNSPKTAWTAVHGRVLDVSDFASRHPGGDTILLAAGRDASVLFETYHPRGVPSALLDKLQVRYNARSGSTRLSDVAYFAVAFPFISVYCSLKLTLLTQCVADWRNEKK
mmetsp:Transcript_47333/g.143336  ORF Transcript_47333/g.143336 Transcript_47333/m.143336 type:complete len:142 (+) Transcript_47333:302-727(+)